MRRAVPRAHLAVAVVLSAPLALSLRHTVRAERFAGVVPTAPDGTLAATTGTPDRVARARDRVRARPEWRGLRRRLDRRGSDAPPSERKGCEGERISPPDRRPARDGCSGASQVFSVIATLLLGALLVALFVGVLWALLSRRRGQERHDESLGEEEKEAFSPVTPPGERPVSTYLQRAQAFAEAGDHRRALRELLLGGMSWTERNGLIRFRKGLTNRDYLRALSLHNAQRAALANVVLEFDKVYFGRRPATAERYERVLPAYRTAFEGDLAPEETLADGVAPA